MKAAIHINCGTMEHYDFVGAIMDRHSGGIPARRTCVQGDHKRYAVAVRKPLTPEGRSGANKTFGTICLRMGFFYEYHMVERAEVWEDENYLHFSMWLKPESLPMPEIYWSFPGKA